MSTLEAKDRENQFFEVERQLLDEQLVAEGIRDEYIGKREEWVGGCATRDALDRYDYRLRCELPLQVFEY